jgi:D-lactate dehydrogenase
LLHRSQLTPPENRHSNQGAAMKVIFFEMADTDKSAIATLAGNSSVLCESAALTRENARAFPDAEIVSTALDSSLVVEVMDEFAHLKLIATRSTGFDHIDLDYCRKRGVGVCNVPVYGDSTVAEHAFALLLALSRNVVDSVEATRRGDFSLSTQRGFELHDKTIGIIGAGHIGLRAIEIARGFGMKVLAYDLYPRPERAEALGFRYAGLEEIYAAADVLSLHVPETPETDGMISDHEFARMKDGVVLINTARGDLVNVTALIRALSSGKVGAAGLDVLPREALIRHESAIFRKGAATPAGLPEAFADHALLRFPNVIVTPHNAYNTKEALQRIITTTVENIAAFMVGRTSNRIV